MLNSVIVQEAIKHSSLILWSLGGVAGILAMVLKGVGPVIHFAIQKCLANPKYAAILLQYRVEIEALFDEIDKQVKADLDAAAQQSPAK